MTAAYHNANNWECLGMPAKVDKSLQMSAKVGKIPVNACKTKAYKYLQMHMNAQYKRYSSGAWSKGVAWGMAWAWSNGNAGNVAWGVAPRGLRH